MEYNVLVATHHKTGTTWMTRVFKKICGYVGCPFYDISDYASKCNTVEHKRAFVTDMVTRLQAGTKAVFFEGHSKFPSFTDEERRRFAGIHVVRDPRDVVISAAKYHTWSTEPWLHRERSEFGGRSYQDAIKALDTFEERLIFEMQHSAGRNIASMVDFDRQGIFRDVKYEDLIGDLDMVVWHGVCIDLGFSGLEIIRAMQGFWDESIFGAAKRTRHVQSGNPHQHRSVFDDQISRAFEAAFPGVLVQLGYDE